jgi:hypothetical protein
VSGYIELMIQGNCRAYVAASNIAGIISSPDMPADSMATADKPMSILLTNGSTIPGVYGVSPNRLLVHVEGAKLLIRKTGRLMLVAYIDLIDKFEEDIAAMMAEGG